MRDDRSNRGPEEIHVGSHFFRWEPPDIGYIAYMGDVDGPTMATLSRGSRAFTVGKPRVFLLVDMTKAGHIDADARKASADGGAGIVLCGVAVVGASPTLRVVAGLVSRAIDILHGNKDNPTRFFETEDEARRWIAERRHTLETR